MTDPYTKQLEEENQKLRNRLEVLQESLEVAELRLEKTNVNGNVYIPSPDEIINGYQLYTIERYGKSEDVIVTCQKKIKKIFSDVKIIYKSFISRPDQKGNHVSNFSYPDNSPLSFNNGGMTADQAHMLLTIAFKHCFFSRIMSTSTNVLTIYPYTQEKDTITYLEKGIVCKKKV